MPYLLPSSPSRSSTLQLYIGFLRFLNDCIWIAVIAAMISFARGSSRVLQAARFNVRSSASSWTQLCRGRSGSLDAICMLTFP